MLATTTPPPAGQPLRADICVVTCGIDHGPSRTLRVQSLRFCAGTSPQALILQTTPADTMCPVSGCRLAHGGCCLQQRGRLLRLARSSAHTMQDVEAAGSLVKHESSCGMPGYQSKAQQVFQGSNRLRLPLPNSEAVLGLLGPWQALKLPWLIQDSPPGSVHVHSQSGCLPHCARSCRRAHRGSKSSPRAPAPLRLPTGCSVGALRGAHGEWRASRCAVAPSVTA